MEGDLFDSLAQLQKLYTPGLRVHIQRVGQISFKIVFRSSPRSLLTPGFLLSLFASPPLLVLGLPHNKPADGWDFK